MKTFSKIEKKLLNNYQQNFPLTPTPFADIAKQLNTDEATVLKHLQALKDQGIISRVGPVFRANRVGVSTLGAMSVPEAKIETVAGIVNKYKGINHNYERDHKFNLWFVATALNHVELQDIISKIEKATNYKVMQLPMLEDYYINLGFNIQWT